MSPPNENFSTKARTIPLLSSPLCYHVPSTCHGPRTTERDWERDRERETERETEKETDGQTDRAPRAPSRFRSICISWEDSESQIVRLSVCVVFPNLGLMSCFRGRKSDMCEPLLPECTTHDDQSFYFAVFVA